LLCCLSLVHVDAVSVSPDPLQKGKKMGTDYEWTVQDSSDKHVVTKLNLRDDFGHKKPLTESDHESDYVAADLYQQDSQRSYGEDKYKMTKSHAALGHDRHDQHQFETKNGGNKNHIHASDYDKDYAWGTRATEQDRNLKASYNKVGGESMSNVHTDIFQVSDKKDDQSVQEEHSSQVGFDTRSSRGLEPCICVRGIAIDPSKQLCSSLSREFCVSCRGKAKLTLILDHATLSNLPASSHPSCV